MKRVLAAYNVDIVSYILFYIDYITFKIDITSHAIYENLNTCNEIKLN